MGGSVMNDEVEEKIINEELLRDFSHGIRDNSEVGSDTTAVVDGAAGGCFEGGNEGVWDSTDTAVGVAVGIIKGLYATTAGNVVFGGGYFELSAVGEFTGGLDESFAEGAFAEDDGPVVIL